MTTENRGIPACDLVAFDLYGTLLDISGLAARMRPIAGEGAAELLGRWRAAQVERSWRLNRERRYEPWDRVTLGALEEVAPMLSIETRDRLARLWLSVPPFADAGPTLAALKSAGIRRAVLSNGTRSMITAALEAAGVGVDRILTADDVRVYKPDPRVYALLDAEAESARTLFVSSNGWDAEGASHAGRAVAWVDRGGEPPAIAPKYRIPSLAAVMGLPG